MFVLAHLSDPHLAPLPTPRFSELASKRLLGFLNWQRKRRNIHRADMLAQLVADLKAQNADHIAVAGDLVNIALVDEFLAARHWLAALGPASDVTLVPGNHDAYVRRMQKASAQYWGDYMRGDSGAETDFPFVRRRGPIAIVGLSTAVASPPFRATGRLGKAQLQRATEILSRLADEGVFRVVMLHHPPESDPYHHAERLIDGAALAAMLAQAGAELVIHGHKHINSVSWLEGPGRRIPAVGVPSASAALGGTWEPAGYNLYRIEGTAGAWRCQMVSRSIAADGVATQTAPRTIVWH